MGWDWHTFIHTAHIVIENLWFSTLLFNMRLGLKRYQEQSIDALEKELQRANEQLAEVSS